jgi:hypothetical protein
MGTRNGSGLPDTLERRVKVVGFMPMMLDRYGGDNKIKLDVSSKFYFMPDGKTLCIPAINLTSFLSAKNTTSVARLVGGKTFNSIADAFLSYVHISPSDIPITRDGVPIVFHGFTNDRDEESGIYVDRRVARLPKGIPNPKERPVIPLPWEMMFNVTIYKNDVIDEVLLKRAFERGGLALGIGTYRGLFGKFTIAEWQ